MEFSEITKKYWEPKDWEDLANVKSFKDLYIIAERVIARQPKPIIQVCGPIATGGLGTIEANLNAFNETIKKLQDQGFSIFDQMPYEEPMQTLKTLDPSDDHLERILTDFYWPIFNSGLVSAMYFMPNWQTSNGATKEHAKAIELGIKIVYL
ncbi:MAG: DUF4406 domain-containing protein [Candidatus Pacebacteria bacterium]|nr:DUF4406 domain-containing protein [Candidatus Paceibacterota bacterium]